VIVDINRRKQDIANIMYSVSLSGAKVAPFGVPTPHFPPGEGMQSAEDIVSLLGRSHYRIVFMNVSVNEIGNWISDSLNYQNVVSAITTMPDQVPASTEYIGVYHVTDKGAERVQWHVKQTTTTISWRKVIPK
jgi:hypothetical protein